MTWRIALFVLVLLVTFAAESTWVGWMQPEAGINLALAQVNGDGANAAAMRTWTAKHWYVEIIIFWFPMMMFIVLFGKPITRWLKAGRERSESDEIVDDSVGSDGRADRARRLP